MNPVSELNKIGKTVGKFDAKLAAQIYEAAEELFEMDDEKIVDRLDDTTDRIEDIKDELDDVIDELDDIANNTEETAEKIAKTAEAKSVGLFQEGDKIVLLGSEMQGVYQGRIYIAGQEVSPGYIVVCEENGTQVGIFKKERFNKFNNEF